MNQDIEYKIRILLLLRAMLDGEIDKAIEKVLKGTFDDKETVLTLNQTIFDSNLVKDILDE